MQVHLVKLGTYLPADPGTCLPVVSSYRDYMYDYVQLSDTFYCLNTENRSNYVKYRIKTPEPWIHYLTSGHIGGNQGDFLKSASYMYKYVCTHACVNIPSMRVPCRHYYMHYFMFYILYYLYKNNTLRSFQVD